MPPKDSVRSSSSSSSASSRLRARRTCSTATCPPRPGRRGRPRARRRRAAGGRATARMTDDADVVVFDLPMRVRFRGQERRSGVLLRGVAGWGEFSPFPDYDAATCARWLAAAREAADEGWPTAVRDSVPVNTTVPAVGPGQAHAMVSASGCSTAKVKVAEPGQTLAEDIARVEAVRDALGSAGRVRVDANAAWTVDEAAVALKALDAF